MCYELVMMETIDLGPTPCDEPCAQLGDDGYEIRSRMECRVFRDQIERCCVAHFGENLPNNVHIKVQNFPHDFGEYREVVVRFDPFDARAVDIALWIESNVPERWDVEALRQLLPNAGDDRSTLSVDQVLRMLP